MLSSRTTLQHSICHVIFWYIYRYLINFDFDVIFLKFVWLTHFSTEIKLKLFSELNLASSNFKYTIEHAKNSEINFLDTTLFFSRKTNKIELRHYEKPSKSEVTINFKKSLAPSSHKRNAITGACNRIRKKYSVHDEENKFKNGDKVSIRECKPYSKSKKFEVIGDVKWYKFKQNYL